MLTDYTVMQSMKFRSTASLQVTLDQDYNVPDQKADIEKMIVEGHEIQIQNTKLMIDKLIVKGSLFWRTLYLKDRQSCRLEHMEGELPFEEIINMDGLTEDADVHVDCETEDMRVTMIHSRKVSVRAVLNLRVRAETMEEISAISGVNEQPEAICLQKQRAEVSQIAVRKKDTIRIREEMELPANKANMIEILWGEVQNRRVDIRPLNDKLLLRGEASVFLLYSGENEENPFEYEEMDLPWHAELPCSGMKEGMIVSSYLHKVSQTLEMKADMDGEMRIVMVEMVLETDLCAYEEKEVEIVSDAYSLNCQLYPVEQVLSAVHMVIRNQTECKLYDKVRMPGDHVGILQLCHPWAEIRMDRLEMTKEGIRAEGAADVHILYVNGDDQMPLDVVNAMLPFSCMIETGVLPENVEFEVYPYLDHMSALMTGQDTAEIRMTIRLDTMVFQPLNMKVMTAIEEEAVDDNSMEALPNMTGYVVKRGDSLFSIGKRFCTTAEKIKSINHMEKEEISEGERLLVIKHYK